MSETRNTYHRIETFDLLQSHASDNGTVGLSNRAIRDILAEHGRTVSLPAVTARLQSLERLGYITVQYHVGENGRVKRKIWLHSRPPAPIHPRRQQEVPA